VEGLDDSPQAVKARRKRRAVRIVVADDEQNVRSALRVLLQVLAPELTGARQDGPCRILEAACAGVVVRELTDEDADFLLLDWELPGMAAADLVERVRLLSPGCTIIAMSGRPEAARVALDGGADAFVSKSEPPDRLVSALLRRVPV
jgi:DNA-binding NarL/FixJ family response regulator